MTGDGYIPEDVCKLKASPIPPQVINNYIVVVDTYNGIFAECMK